MTDPRPALQSLLQQLQQELQQQSLWQGQPPAADAFASQTPFFADTMAFHQWLQWVFIPRFQALLDSQQPLPSQCNVAPMAEEAFKSIDAHTDVLVELLTEFDQHFG